MFDAFGGRSTTAQEVSKSTEVQYTTLQLRAATGQEPGPARQNIIGEFDERSLVNYYTGGRRAVRKRARARARAWLVSKNANYEFLRCISNVVGVPLIFLLFFSPPFFRSLFRSFALLNEEDSVAGRRKSKHRRGLRRRNSETTGENS